MLRNNPVRWLVTLWKVSDHDLIAYVGADAYMFLRFLRLAYWVALAATVVGLLVLLPVNTVGGEHLAQLERLSMSNVADNSGLLWVHFAAAYGLAGLVLYLLHREYKVYTDLRQRYLRSPTAQNYSLLVRDIPQRLDGRTLKPYLTNLLGEDVATIHYVNHHRRLRYDRLVARKDKTLVRLARAVREFEATNHGRGRPTHRTSMHLGPVPLRFFPNWGPRVDTIDALKEELADCNRRLAMLHEQDETQAALEGPVQACVVTVELVRVATAFKTIPFQPFVEYMSVAEAPAPQQVLWQNLATPWWTRRLRSVLVWTVVLAAILAYTIPVAFASSLANLTALSHTQAFGWLRPLVTASPTVTALIQGYLPPLIVAVLLSLVPSFMKALSKQQGLPADVACENAAIFKVFLFSLLDIVLAYTIAGSFLAKIQQFTDLAGHPADLVPLFATTLPAQSTFFMTYLALGALNALPAELLRLGPLVWTTVQKKWLMKTRGLWDNLDLLTEPQGMHELYNFPLVAFLALVTYAVVAPLLPLFALVYFALAYPVYVHLLLYVYQPTAHTGGTQWPVVCGCCITALVVQELLLLGIFGIKKAAVPAALMVPLLVATIGAGVHFRKDYARVTQVATLESLAHTDVAEYGPSTWASLKAAYAPYLDDGRKQEVSREKLGLWAEPYGVVTQGVFSDGQRPTVCVMNSTPEEEFHQERGEEERTAAGPTTGTTYGSVDDEEALHQVLPESGLTEAEEREQPERRTIIKLQVRQRNGAEGGEEGDAAGDTKWENLEV